MRTGVAGKGASLHRTGGANQFSKPARVWEKTFGGKRKESLAAMILCQNNHEVTYQGRVLSLPRPSAEREEEGLPRAAFSPRSVLGVGGQGQDALPPPAPNRKDSSGSFAVPPICSLDDVIASADVILFNDDAFANINMNMNLVEDPPAAHSYCYQPHEHPAAACGGAYNMLSDAYSQPQPPPLYSEYGAAPMAAMAEGDTVVPQIMEGVVARNKRRGGGRGDAQFSVASDLPLPTTPAKRRRQSMQQQQPMGAAAMGAQAVAAGQFASGKVSPATVLPPQMPPARRSIGTGGAKKTGSGSRRRSSFPKATTAVLKGWLRRHFLNPYPSDADKKQLCSECDLTISQLQVRCTSLPSLSLLAPFFLPAILLGKKIEESNWLTYLCVCSLLLFRPGLSTLGSEFGSLALNPFGLRARSKGAGCRQASRWRRRGRRGPAGKPCP